MPAPSPSRVALEVAAACAECGAATIPGVNSDFCSLPCEQTWTTAHTWPCPECDGACVVEVVAGWVGLSSQPITEELQCEACNGSGDAIDFDRDRRVQAGNLQ